LVIEDDDTFLNVLCIIFKSKGFDVDTAINGKDGYNKVLTENFDLVTCDLKMHGMDGEDIINGLQKAGKKVPIIVISGMAADKKVKEDLYNYKNVKAVFPKPFQNKELLKTIKEILGN